MLRRCFGRHSSSGQQPVKAPVAAAASKASEAVPVGKTTGSNGSNGRGVTVPIVAYTSLAAYGAAFPDAAVPLPASGQEQQPVAGAGPSSAATAVSGVQAARASIERPVACVASAAPAQPPQPASTKPAQQEDFTSARGAFGAFEHRFRRQSSSSDSEEEDDAPVDAGLFSYMLRRKDSEKAVDMFSALCSDVSDSQYSASRRSMDVQPSLRHAPHHAPELEAVSEETTRQVLAASSINILALARESQVVQTLGRESHVATTSPAMAVA